MTVKPPSSLRTSSPTNNNMPGASRNTGGRGHSNRRNCHSSRDIRHCSPDIHSIRTQHTAPRNRRDSNRHSNMAPRARFRSGLRRRIRPHPSPNLPIRHASRPNHHASRPIRRSEPLTYWRSRWQASPLGTALSRERFEPATGPPATLCRRLKAQQRSCLTC
jgi:hypothetical protein